MKEITDFLIESILDTSEKYIDRKDAKGFSRYFQKGDTCLWLREFSQNRENKVSFSIAKITKVTTTMVKYIETKQNSDGEWIESNREETFKRKRKNDKYPYSANYSASATLLPEFLSKEAAQIIVNKGSLTAGYYWAGDDRWNKNDRETPVVVFDGFDGSASRSKYKPITPEEAKTLLKGLL